MRKISGPKKGGKKQSIDSVGNFAKNNKLKKINRLNEKRSSEKNLNETKKFK